MALPELYINVNPVFANTLAGPVTLTFVGGGKALETDQQASSIFIIERAHGVAEQVRGLWDVEQDSPLAKLNPTTFAARALYNYTYSLDFIPLALRDLRDLDSRLAAYEALAGALTEPALRARTLPILRWALLPALREQYRGGVNRMDPAARAIGRSLYAPHLGPYLAGMRHVKNLDAFIDYHSADDLTTIIIDELSGGRHIDLSGGYSPSHPQALLTQMEAQGWCVLGDCDGCYSSYSGYGATPHRPHPVAKGTAKVKRLYDEERFDRLSF
jgi:hypothetical protein